MIIGLIPSRLNSTRLPKKPLLLIDGLPLIVHTYKRAALAKKIDRVIVCTDSLQIKKIIENVGGEAILTKKNHVNGTERINEVALKLKAELIIDIQGDEPLLNPKDIDAVINFHKQNPQFDIIVPSSPISNPNNPNNVKIVSNSRGEILYMSRSPIPNSFNSSPKIFLKHLSIISFKKKVLSSFSKMRQSRLEKIEGIELLRAVENNLSIGTFIIKSSSFAVDVRKDYEKILTFMPSDPIRKLY